MSEFLFTATFLFFQGVRILIRTPQARHNDGQE